MKYQLKETPILKFKTIIFSILYVVTSTLALEESSDKVSTFNKNMTNRNNVDLYSGNFIYEYPIGQLGPINLKLMYSSNIRNSIRNSNAINPVGIVGLGWQLGKGAIYADHKGTTSTADDDFYYSSPLGISSKICRQGGNYLLENDPYSKISPTVTSDGLITGWEVTTIDGIRWYYGTNGSDDRPGTVEYTFSVGTIIEPGIIREEPMRYPYRWNISGVTDLLDQRITFNYSQKTEKVSYKNSSGVKTLSSSEYTKATYLSSIVGKDGDRVEFYYTSKPSEERIDPFTFVSEPDQYIECIEDSLLDSVAIFNTNNTRMKAVKLSYLQLNNNTSLKSSLRKSTISQITEYFGLNNQKVRTTVFSYNNDLSATTAGWSSDFYLDDYYYGALSGIASSDGNKTYIQYEEVGVPIKDITQKHAIQDLITYRTGTTTDGYPFVAILTGTTNTTLRIFTWMGSKWDNTYDDIVADTKLISGDIYSSDNHLFIKKVTPKHSIDIYSWENEKWGKTKEILSSSGAPMSILHNGNHALILEGTTLLTGYSWDNTEWKATLPQKNVSSVSANPYPQFIESNAFAISGQSKIEIYRWAGDSWSSHEQTFTRSESGNAPFCSVSFGKQIALQVDSKKVEF